jgi:hypothetical protein
MTAAARNDRMPILLGKQHGTLRKTKHRGVAAVAGDFVINVIAYNLIRIPKLLVA